MIRSGLHRVRRILAALIICALLGPPDYHADAGRLYRIGGWVRTTYYYATGSLTATGTVPHFGQVAVDRGAIPLGSRIHIPGLGTFTATDTGGAVNGAHHLDIFLDYPGQVRLADYYRGVWYTTP